MPSINSIPPEIQQKILRHVISVPCFLDPDGIASTDILAMSEYHAQSILSKWNDKYPYYATERDRNSCRRVCASWNIYLQETIGHRYVDMVDIRHGKIPTTALRNAIRVSVSVHPWGCSICNGGREDGGDISMVNTKAMKFLRDTFDVIGETRTRIITGVRLKALALLVDYMPDIVTIASLFGGQGMCHSISRFRQLRHLYFEPGEIYFERLVLDAPNLRTLSFFPLLFTNTNFAHTHWNLPSLLTVRVSTGPHGLASLQTGRPIESLLRAVGSNIRNLFLPYAHLSMLTLDIWEICPNLKNITATRNGSVIEGVPSSHPLRTILIACYEATGPLLCVPTTHTSPTTSRIGTVVVDCPWAYRFPERLIRSWATYWEKHSIRAEDVYGTPVQDWIAILDQRKAWRLCSPLQFP